MLEQTRDPVRDQTALHWGAERGLEEMVWDLLSQGL